MVVKSDNSPAPIGQRPTKQPGKFYTSILNAVSPLVILFAVLSGLVGSPDNLDQMGIHLGPNHS